ncbi:tungsten ABC transporter substrate-binding protein [Enterovibrio norvegicus FF-33]|uniref:Tungsten ABC transporter substrate-binding protein n=1 Tax=Enterovibrio norvegicus FF-454 TaxID=1185651 RepID=A0A1E5C0C8_9GAMM|nr:substrate-binding domain-containing protein [Enterovibrio norvegicus]OEE58891.1 tungsten ABC transporter substrate-binding protein [Enterovibrio norvegicus FF-454]OEE67955.1 tungsten ABC transporter substrate-binding protein [Enterovibrio norvegicus FF-33]OEE75508.1 tungsten ABC transporter substrate-binding protein [Enterovibrio norvegicus FF-162]
MSLIKKTKAFVLLSVLVSFSATVSAAEIVRLATTTSTYHSGLLDFLLPEFKKDTGYDVQVLAAGTGKALKMGENGDVDLVMTHAPKAEASFVDQGFGVLPRGLMYNDFVLVGPKNDPAKIKASKDVTAALVKVASADAHFISRGDDSGTHKKELLLWKAAGIHPDFSAYKAVGQGMGPTLTMANELQGYALTDRGTWLAYQSKMDLDVLVQGDARLFNPYQVILINPSRYPDLNYQGAKVLSDWLVNPKAQAMIDTFKVNGQQLFVADAS